MAALSPPVALIGQEGFPVETDRGKDLGRQIDLAPRTMNGHQEDCTGHGLGDACMADNLGGTFCGLGVEDQRGELDERCCRLARISFEHDRGFHRIVVKVEDACVSHRNQRSNRQAPGLYGAQELCGHRVGCGLAMGRTLEQVTPVLQAHLAGQGLAHQVANTGELGIVGVERGDGRAPIGRRQQTCEIAVVVRLLQGPQAKRLIGRRGLAHDAPFEDDIKPRSRRLRPAVARPA